MTAETVEGDDMALATGVVERPVWFGEPGRMLFGWLAMPADGRVRGGVLVCPPVGRDGFSTHRTVRTLTLRAAAAGLVALRFDYRGTGDSDGGSEDPGQVEGWLHSIAAARAHLADLGVSRIATVGLRLGATLAAFDSYLHHGEAAATGSLVLWDPCASGRMFLREGEALLGASEAGALPQDPAYRHTPGFQFTLATAAELRDLDLAKLPSEHPLASRVLLLQREDRPQPAALRERLAAEGDRISFEPAWGQAELIDVEVVDMTVPERALERVLAWIGEGVADAPWAPLREPALVERRALVHSGAGATVAETARAVGNRGIRGIVSEPADGLAQGPWLVLLNVGTDHHIGPGRMWVDLARDWAARGHRVLRIDHTGSGDSATHGDQIEARPYAPHWIDDMRDLVATLRADGVPVVLMGVCAGAYSAMEAALWEEVDGVFAISPILTLHSFAAKGMAHYTPRRRAAKVPGRVMSRVPREKLRLAYRLWWVWTQLAFWNAPFRVIRSIVRRGTRLSMLVSKPDARALTGYLLWRGAFARLRRNPRFQFTVKPDLTHGLLDRGSQQYARAALTAFVEQSQRVTN